MTQAHRAPAAMAPGHILTAPHDVPVTIFAVDACVSLLVDGHLWVWPRRSAERVLATMGYRVAGAEDPAVLAERVELARAEARARRAA